MVASAVAIPCTAPFLGTAAAFAIQGSILEMCSVFFAIATGFSIPYITSLFIPFVISAQCGRFSVFFKKIIDCGVLITFFWIFWLLSSHLSKEIILLHLLVFVLSTFLFIKKHTIAALTAISILLIILHRTDIQPLIAINQRATSFINSKAAKKHVVIFNITADWCVTCQYNKRTVFKDERIVKMMKDYGIEYIEGNITKKDNVLMDFIQKHDRAGIPFTVIYGPNAQDGILLGEILSVEEVTNAIVKASGNKVGCD
jgi:suppressor for copper-sensitivity B